MIPYAKNWGRSILKGDKVICLHTLVQVRILKGLEGGSFFGAGNRESALKKAGRRRVKHKAV